MKPYTTIENPAAGATYCHPGMWGVYHYDTFPKSSVLAGQERRSMLDLFATLDQAKQNYPEAEIAAGSLYTEHVIPSVPPEWFDPTNIGESWDGD